MIARLWWKEARQVGPIWLFLAGLGMVWLAALRWWVDALPTRVALVGQVTIIAFLYMFLVGAAAFAGERENRTLGLLDILPVQRWRVWVAKASFAAATTLALGLVLSPLALPATGWPPAYAQPVGGLPPSGLLPFIGFFFLCAFGWSLVWSALLSNTLLAAALAMVSMAAVYVQLNWGQTVYSAEAAAAALTVWHWPFAVALVAASAAILHFGGPARISWPTARRRSRAELPGTTHRDAREYESVRAWEATTPRLAWQALRETWPVWWPLMALGLALLAALVSFEGFIDTSISILGAILAGLVLGANVFNAENRRGTQRFLAAHGARPGVVWLVKLAVGLMMVAPVVAVWAAPSFWGLGKPASGAPEGWTSFQFSMVLIGILAGNAFAAGALSGMVFRRGITAALVSFILWGAATLPPFLLLVAGVAWPTHLLWVPVAILAVTWAWSGDWLLQRPGFGRWARLGLYSAAAVAALFSAHVANRVWGVPTIPPDQWNQIFQFDRIAAAVPADENAAGLYREVGAADPGNPPIKSREPWEIPGKDWDANAPELLDWLSRNKTNLETLRKAAAMPVCRFQDLRTMTGLSVEAIEPPGLSYVDLALATSARVRFARGDLKGAWEDIEVLLRMARQFAGLNPEWIRRLGDDAERVGLGLALRWANDPRLTAELLTPARDSYRALPPPLTQTDQARAEALVLRNTAERLSRVDLMRVLTDRLRRPPDLSETLSFDLMTTPWELARLRRVIDLVAAARIQTWELRPRRPLGYRVIDPNEFRYGDTGPAAEESEDSLWIGNGGVATRLSPDDLRRLESTTPLMSRRGAGLSLPDGRVQENDNTLVRPAVDVILSLRLWQAEHDGRLPEWLGELAEDDPGVVDSLIDPYSRANPPARFGYVPSEGQSLRVLEPLRPDSLAARKEPQPTNGYMLLYSVGADGIDDEAAVPYGFRRFGDIIFPIKDDVPPPE